MRKSFVAATLAAILGLSVPAQAQNFPDRPITMIIPFAAGFFTDAAAPVV